MRKLSLIFPLLCALSLAAPMRTFAVDAPTEAGTTAPAGAPASAAPTAPASAAAATGGDAASIKASIKKSVLKTGLEIKEMGVAMRQISHAATELYGEMTRQDMVSLGSPDLIGTMVIPAIPVGPIGLGPYLEPRKKWVDLCMAHLSQSMPLLQEEIADISPALHAETKDEADPVLAEVNALMTQIQSSYAKLQTLTEAAKYDNVAIGNECVTMTESLKKLEKLRKQLWKAVKT